MPVPVFSAGEVLTAANMNKVGMWQVGTFTAAGTNRALVCDNIFTSDYDSYRIVVSMRSTVNTNGMFYQYIDTSGTTIVANYYGTTYGQDFTTGATAFSGTLNSTTAQFIGWVPNSTTAPLSASFDIFSPRLSTVTTSVVGMQSSIASGASYFGGAIMGTTTVTTAFRGIRFDNNGAGNITGTVRVYGYRN